MRCKFGWIILGLTCLLILNFYASAQAVTVQEILTGNQKTTEKISNLSLDIQNTIYFPAGASESSQETTKQQTGQLIYQFPNQANLMLSDPMGIILVCNGIKVKRTLAQSQTSTIESLAELRAKGGGLPIFIKVLQPLEQQLVGYTLRLETASRSEKIVGLVATRKIADPTPKNQSPPRLEKIKYYIDRQTWLPAKIIHYGQNSTPVATQQIFYTKIDGILVVDKFNSTMFSPRGTYRSETKYSNLKLNAGLNPEVFIIY
jgi:outer membrane lipoprotein-sorting protein